MQLKHFFLLTGIIVFLQPLSAQLEVDENKVFIGGAVNLFMQNNSYPYSLNITGVGGLISSNLNDSKNFQFSFAPYAGYELTNKLSAGLGLNLRTDKYEAENVRFFGGGEEDIFLERITIQYGGNLFFRYTLNPENKLNAYLQPYAGFQFVNTDEKHDSNIVAEEKANYLDLGIGLGLLYQINDRWRATLRMGGLSYISGRWEVTDTQSEKDFSSFRFNASLSTIYLGFEMSL